MSKNYQLIVFDWDGTLCDSIAHIVHAVDAALKELELPAKPPDQIREYIGLSIESFVQHLMPEVERAKALQFIDRYHYHFFKRIKETTLYPGVREFLQRLKQVGYTVAIATGKTHSELQRVIDELALREFIDTVRCADQTYAKPEPHMLLEIMDECDCSPEQTLMVGDTEYDLLMAENAGVDAVALSTGVHSCDYLCKFKPIVCYNKLTDVAKILNKF